MFGVKPSVVFTFDKKGGIQIEIENASGPGCLKLTDKIRDKLSNCQVEEKAEIHETQVDQTLTQGLG